MKRTLDFFVWLLMIGVGLAGCGKIKDVNEQIVLESTETSESATHLGNVGTSTYSEALEKKELILAGNDFDESIISAVTTFNCKFRLI